MRQMKKLTFLITVLLLVFAMPVLAAKSNIRTTLIFDSETIALSATATSAVIDMGSTKPGGFFSIHVKDLTDDGTMQLTYELSADNVTYVTPSSASDIVTAHTKTTGPGSDGEDLYSFTPELARYMRIIATETGGANAIVVTAFIIIQ